MGIVTSVLRRWALRNPRFNKFIWKYLFRRGTMTLTFVLGMCGYMHYLDEKYGFNDPDYEEKLTAYMKNRGLYL